MGFSLYTRIERSSNCSVVHLPSYSTRFYFRTSSPISQEQVWTLLWHARRIPIRRLWHRRALGERPTHTTRSPILLLSLSGLFLLRLAERQFSGLLFHEPPRSTRSCLSLLYSLNQVREVNICLRNSQVSPCSKWANQL